MTLVKFTTALRTWFVLAALVGWPTMLVTGAAGANLSYRTSCLIAGALVAAVAGASVCRSNGATV